MKHLTKIFIIGVASVAVAGCASAPRQAASADDPKGPKAAENAESPTQMAKTFDEAARRGDAAWSSGDTVDRKRIEAEQQSFHLMVSEVEKTWKGVGQQYGH